MCHLSAMLSLCVFIVLLHGVPATLMDDRMTYDDIEAYHHHPCKRPCLDDEPPMVCEYDFLLEHYHTLTKACYNCPLNPQECFRPHCVPADGQPRGIITVNRMMPGPGIHVCYGDTIRVRVHNKLEMSEGVTIHWHGVLQQGTPYMDGVAMVTQCSVPEHTSFTYTFQAVTRGTHFWHAHSGLQRSDGVFGHLVIREPPGKEVHIDHYDLDLPQHAMMVNDWWGQSIAQSYSQFHHALGSNQPTSILINGKGAFKKFHDPRTGQNVTTPREEFSVRPGYKYRFRVVSNGILNCPIRISVDDHVITIIASDGSPVEPMEVESFSIFAGERYDFILEANQNVSSYLIRATGQIDCAAGPDPISQTAILKYEGALEDDTVLNTPVPQLHGIELNPVNIKQSATKVQVSELRSMLDDDPAVTRKPDQQIVVGMDLQEVNNPRFHNQELYSVDQVKPKYRPALTPQMNHITMKKPTSPVLSQYSDVSQDLFCNKDSLPHDKDCVKEFCECTHYYKVKLGDVVEVILVDEGRILDLNHPIHLHGHQFRVVAMGKLGKSTWASTVQEMDMAGNITRNLDRPPSKDTVTVPDGGYTVIRFHANNPGVWFFHCHIQNHIVSGMGLLFQVGDPWEFPRRPSRFPQCGSWDGFGDDKDRAEEERENEEEKERDNLRERLDRLEKLLIELEEDKGKDQGHALHAGILAMTLCCLLRIILF